MYSPKLRRLIAGVLDLTWELFPGVVDEQIDYLSKTLPPPPAIIRRRFDQALTSSKVDWEHNQDTGALWAKMRSEAPFDSAVDIVPRFVGKRLFHFGPWSDKTPTTILSRALIDRFQVELAQKPAHKNQMKLDFLPAFSSGIFRCSPSEPRQSSNLTTKEYRGPDIEASCAQSP